MLGKTAGGIFWMFRYLERSEHMARLLDAGLRIALTRTSASAEDEWRSIVISSGADEEFESRHDSYESQNVIDFMLRDKQYAGSVISMIGNARSNARLVRTALTREVWEATNECWMSLRDRMARPIRERDLPELLGEIRRQSALVRGALHGTMLRNDIYNFARLGTFLERADSTARILDVKYYVLLPSVHFVGSSLDNLQWDNILRSVSGQRAFRWLNSGDPDTKSIADFLLFDKRFPRSLRFCQTRMLENLQHLADDYGVRHNCHEIVERMDRRLKNESIDSVFDFGLHEFITEQVQLYHLLAAQIEKDYRFYE